jgi:hypothetical protein
MYIHERKHGCRREKNKLSAQQSRQRKKCHLETLEARVQQLEGERAALQVHDLETHAAYIL